MLLKTFRFLSLVLVALALGPSLAHLLELPNKIGLPRDAYLTVQGIYSGWALLGIVVISELVSVLALTILERGRRRAFALTLAALLCLIASHALFWIFTWPANQATANWTMLPDGGEQLRLQWEYSHATAAGLNTVAFVCLALSVTGESRGTVPV